jgi:hypothetical protein
MKLANHRETGMLGFRSRSKKPRPNTQGVTDRTQGPRLQVGERVKTTADASAHPAGSTGEVTYVDDHGGQTSYEVTFDKGSWKITVAADDLQRIAPYDPHVFEVGTRVRLKEDFAGHLWHEDIAAEMDGQEPKGNPVSYPAGTTGTVTMHPPGAEEVMVQLDYQRLTLAVRFSKLERIRGETRVIEESDGGIRIQQLFGYLDVVRLRKDVPLQDGRVLEAGSVGGIRPMSVQLPPLQLMEECWSTGIYTIFLA